MYFNITFLKLPLSCILKPNDKTLMYDDVLNNYVVLYQIDTPICLKLMNDQVEILLLQDMPLYFKKALNTQS